MQEGQVIDQPEAQVSIASSDWDQQVRTAKRWPRDIVQFKRDLLAMATVDEETASSCQYSLPRANKPIEGPSVRLAEMAVSTYGNLQVSSQVTGHDDRWVYAETVVRDLEKNIAIGVRVKRRITDRHGRTYSDDMIGVTGMAALAISFRNAVFKVVPAAFIGAAYRASQQMLEESAGADLKRAVPAMLAAFKDKGVTEEEVLRYLRVEKPSDIRGIHIVRLRGVINALKDGVAKEGYFGRPAREIDMGDPQKEDSNA